jgi:hypothetical protein
MWSVLSVGSSEFKKNESTYEENKNMIITNI